MEPFFKKAQQIYPSSLANAMNVSLFFVQDFPRNEGAVLYLTGVSDYQVFLNGRLLAYGPARAAYRTYRVDCLSLQGQADENRLVIELSGYNCKSYTRVNESPFLVAEIRDAHGEVLFYSGRDFSCFRNLSRLQKVVRFSYQREFSESYRLDERLYLALRLPNQAVLLPEVEVESVPHGTFLPRGVENPSLMSPLLFLQLEGGYFAVDPSLKVYDDRYMHADFLGIFPSAEWEIDPNRFISQLVYELGESKRHLKTGEFATFAYKVSKTGFLYSRFRVMASTRLYLVFDEIDSRETTERTIGIRFYRNTTHNIVSYELAPGDYSLNSFEPYTAKYIRVIVEKGDVLVKGIGLYPFENPLAYRFRFSFSDPRINAILEAGRNTFAQNAVDILTDCPSRERAGWLCDTYFSGPAEMLYTGENRVERAFLENYARYVNRGDQPEKMIPMCYPCDFGDCGYIPNWPMFYILEIERYLSRHEAATLLPDAKNQLFDFLAWCERFENDEHLLENLEGTVFVEWSHANDAESVCGVNFPTNMLYSEALRAMGEMYGRKDLVLRAREIKEVIRKEAFDGHFFNDNALRDNKGKLRRSGRTSETTQYYAFYFDVAAPEDYPALYACLLEKLGPKRDAMTTLPNVFPSNMFIGDYLRLLFLLKQGRFAQAAEESVDYFAKMASRTGTLWEFDSTYASLTHCFASSIANILLEVYTGIAWISQKDKTLYLSPYPPMSTSGFSLEIPLGDKEKATITSHAGKLGFVLPESWQLSKRASVGDN